MNHKLIAKFFFEAGGMKAGENTSDFSIDISGIKRRTDLIGEGAMAARLATRIKHALEVSTHMKPSLTFVGDWCFPFLSIQH